MGAHNTAFNIAEIIFPFLLCYLWILNRHYLRVPTSPFYCRFSHKTLWLMLSLSRRGVFEQQVAGVDVTPVLLRLWTLDHCSSKPFSKNDDPCFPPAGSSCSVLDACRDLPYDALGCLFSPRMQLAMQTRIWPWSPSKHAPQKIWLLWKPKPHHITWSARNTLKHYHARMQPISFFPPPIDFQSSLCFGLIGSIAFLFFLFFSWAVLFHQSD